MSYTNAEHYLDKLSGGSGDRKFTDTSSHVVAANQIVIDEDATILDVLEISVEGATATDVLTAANSDNKYNYALVELNKGHLITCAANETITKVGASAGKYIVYDKTV